jgi:hypothetical protein
MMRTCFLVLVGFFFLGWRCPAISDQPRKHDDSASTLIPLLPDAGTAEREDMVVALTKKRLALQTDLLKQLNSPKSEEHQISVIYLLGLYRMEGAVRDLANLITLEAKVRIQKREWLWDQYPVVEALVKIGRPAIPAMLENIKAAKGEKVTELSIKVIQHVETLAIAKMILQEVIDKEKDQKKKKNIKESLKYLK